MEKKTQFMLLLIVDINSDLDLNEINKFKKINQMK